MDVLMRVIRTIVIMKTREFIRHKTKVDGSFQTQYNFIDPWWNAILKALPLWSNHDYMYSKS